ncbi:MAG TPA: response regulator transcription factor [Burkholderiales bacterium]|jgi:DNA-binding NarL/FixJ family response regulator|nr:response regulator transcription factor [Burkholderiales bacterium]
MAINIMLLDDHAVVREGLQALLAAQPDLRVTGSFGNSADAVRFAAESPPDVAILDITLDGLDGIEAAKRIHDLCPGTQILMLSMHASPEFVFQSLRAGATGYVLKESAGDELVAAVRAVHGGNRFLSEKIPAKTLDAYISERAPDHPLERLSPRELQVMKLIVDGSTSNEVAALLGVSPKSVDTYRSRLMAKLAIDDMPSLVKFAIRHGMTSV